jgi:hypothetical protein
VSWSCFEVTSGKLLQKTTEVNVKQTYTFDGMRVNRIDTKFPLSGKIRWGAYMGSNYNGVYNR